MRRGIRCAAVLVPLSVALIVQAEPLYRYRDADGHWVYSDRYPVGTTATLAAGQPDGGAAPAIRLYESLDADAPVLIAQNPFVSWTQIAFHVESSRNLDPDAARLGNALLAPGSDTVLMKLERIDPDTPVEVGFSYQYIFGHPGARHRSDQLYRLPFPEAEAHLVSQAYPNVSTHAAVADRHAIDFEMPVGTEVFAARSGIVVEVIDDFVGGGVDFERYAGSGNYLRILHDDGTFALYGHLSWNSIAVVPGQRVGRGEHIADSGNTGFSTGPHLHFVVQRNSAGAVESVPVMFADAAGVPFSPMTGELAGGS